MTFDPKDWALFHYRSTIVNAVGASGAHDHSIVPGRGNMMRFLYGTLLNGDTAGRALTVQLLTTGNFILTNLLGAVTVAAGARRNFPTDEVSADGGGVGSTPLYVAGDDQFFVRLAAVAVSENSEFAFVALMSAGEPTVTITSPTAAVETVSESEMV